MVKSEGSMTYTGWNASEIRVGRCWIQWNRKLIHSVHWMVCDSQSRLVNVGVVEKWPADEDGVPRVDWTLKTWYPRLIQTVSICYHLKQQ